MLYLNGITTGVGGERGNASALLELIPQIQKIRTKGDNWGWGIIIFFQALKYGCIYPSGLNIDKRLTKLLDSLAFLFFYRGD